MKRFQNPFKPAIRPLLIVVASVLSVACASGDHDDLRSYVQQVKARPAGHISPLPEFEVSESYAYASAERHDPFSARQTAVLAGSPAGANDLRPDMDRYKEALEQFPLDGLEFSGLLERENVVWAIITAPDKLVHSVRVGNHLGQNYGKVVRISETKIEIEEIVPDGLGGWIKRDAALAIAE
jgi:type IV pilus assembly protein PilP